MCVRWATIVGERREARVDWTRRRADLVERRSGGKAILNGTVRIITDDVVTFGL